MTRLKPCLLLAAIFITSSSLAFTTNDAVTVFNAYNSAFQVAGYYPGWWTGAEEIEMAEDAFENSPTLARQSNVSTALNQFAANHTSNWISGGGFNKYNDDICWAVIAFARGYLITGNTTFRNIAKSNWDDHPVGYWRLNETSGTVAHDYVTGNNGVYTPNVVLGHPGYNFVDTNTCARFGFLATSNSCVTNVNVDFATTGNAGFAVEAWVNGTARTTDAGLITKGYGAGGEQFNLDCGAGSHAFRFFVRDAGGAAHVANSSVVPNGQWHHLVGVCDEVNGGVYLYVDGARAGSTTIGTNTGLMTSTLAANFGSRKSGAGTAYDLQFTGYMQEVAIYNYALSSNRVSAHFLAATNRAPGFVSNPFMMAGITSGQSYSGTLATNASDPNGDTMTFSKVGGPAWLNVAGNGSLTGTPHSSDTGTNGFLVKVSDPAGLFSTATMNLAVASAPSIFGAAVFQGADLMLTWSGGIGPYQVWQATNMLNPTWVPVGPPTSANNLSVPVTNPAAFYRIGDQ